MIKKVRQVRNNILQYLFIAIVIILIGVAVYSIYGTREIEEESNEEEELEITNIQNSIRLGIAEYDTLNPIVSKNKYVQEISRILFEPLITITSDYKLENALAEEWSKINETTYLIKLKDNITWHDGEKLVAKDVQFTMDRLKEGNSIYSSNVEKVTSLEVIDDITVKIILSEEVPFFEYYLTFPIVPYHQYLTEDFWTSTRNVAGTGMYKIKEITEDQIILKENEDWWNWKEPYKTQNIYINLYSSVGELYNAFKLGNIDLINTSNTNLSDYIGTIGYSTKEYKGREWDYLVCNTSDNVLKNKEVRQAIQYGIDKNNIVASVFGSKYSISNFPLDFGNYLIDGENVESKFNLELAKQTLLDNGWTYNYGTWRKTINYRNIRTSINLVVKNSNANQVAVAELIKKQLKEVGITIQIIKASDYQYNRYLTNKNYQMILIGVNAPISIDIDSFVGKENYSNYVNEEISNLLIEIKNIQDENKIKEKKKKIADIYFEEAPWIGLYYNKNTVAYSNNLRAELTPNWYNIYYNINDWYRET